MLKSGVDRMTGYSLNQACKNCGGAFRLRPGKWDNPLFCSEACELTHPEVAVV